MQCINALALAVALALSGAALAHGDAGHAKKAAPVKQEQKDWGIVGDAKSAKRTIEVKMLDTMRFSPESIDVKLGETVRFSVRNDGKQMHEFVIGTRAENDEHAALMVKFPTMEHDEPYTGGHGGQDQGGRRGPLRSQALIDCHHTP